MENSFEWTKDIGEIPEIKYPVTKDFIPETLEWCKHHYVPPMDMYITCCDFGNNDGMNGSCHWCLEMTHINLRCVGMQQALIAIDV